jgi:hypothetical protein
VHKEIEVCRFVVDDRTDPLPGAQIGMVVACPVCKKCGILQQVTACGDKVKLEIWHKAVIEFGTPESHGLDYKWDERP